MRAGYACAIVGLALAPAAFGQPVSDRQTGAPSDRETHLHIAAEGSVSILPDVLVADLLASDANASAAAAQHKVNDLMAAGLREARDAAMVAALHALRERAAAAAEALGMHVGRIQDVQMEAPSVLPFRPMMAARTMAAAAPPPAATIAAEPVTSQASADIVLER